MTLLEEMLRGAVLRAGTAEWPGDLKDVRLSASRKFLFLSARQGQRFNGALSRSVLLYDVKAISEESDHVIVETSSVERKIYIRRP